MKFRTKRESEKGISYAMLLFGIIGFMGFFASLYVKDEFMIRLSLFMAVLGIGVFVYTHTCNMKRNLFKEKGVAFDGTIVEAKRRFNGRGEDTYFLLISFTENGVKKIRFTEGYEGDPNLKLKHTHCKIYKYNDKYIEADFVTLNKGEQPKKLNIYTTEYSAFESKKQYV